MNMSMDHAILTLPRHATLELADAGGARITVLTGSVWITQDRDTRDILIGPGDSFTVDRDGLILVHAMELARVHVEQPVSAGEPASLFRALWRYWQSRRASGSGRDTIGPTAPPARRVA